MIDIRKVLINEIDEIESIYDISVDWLLGQGINQWKKGVYPTRKSAQQAFDEGSLYCCIIGLHYRIKYSSNVYFE